MKKMVLGWVVVALLSACSHQPPKPFGTEFPINKQVHQG